MDKIKTFLKSIGINRDTVERTVSTFIQAFLAYIATVLAAGEYFADGVTKKAVIGLVLSAVAAGLSAVKNAIKNMAIEQKGSGSSMTFAEFVKKYLGKKTDWDGVYGVQCVDLIDCYIDKVLELEKGFWGNAKYWWINRSKSAWLKANFDFITPKYKNGELKAGDIGIRTSGTWGHIFIVAEATENGKIKYYDQNADGKGAAMTLRVKPYTSDFINGILRPKAQEKIAPKPKKAKKAAKPYGNAKMLSEQQTYADSSLTLSIGSVPKGYRVKQLDTGEGNPLVVYKIKNGYKTAFVKKGTVKKD